MMKLSHRKALRTPVLVVATAALISINQLDAKGVRCLTEPFGDVEMSTMVPGSVAKVHFGEGTFVNEGEVILELDTSSEQLSIQRRTVMMNTLKASLERSEMLLEKTSTISMEEVDEARSEYDMAVIELEMARDALGKKQLRAPFSGVVTELVMQVGEYCEPPQVILRMVDTERFYCEANIDPVAAAKLKVGDPVIYTPESSESDVMIPGEIVFISPVLDPASGLLRIKAICTNPDGLVRPGEGGSLELEPEA